MPPVNLFPGTGRALHDASVTGVKTDPETLTIAAGGYSTHFGVDDCIDFGADIIMISGVADADILLEKCTDVLMSHPTTHATIAINTKWTISFNNGGPAHGSYFRFKNPGTKTCQITLQKRIL